MFRLVAKKAVQQHAAFRGGRVLSSVSTAAPVAAAPSVKDLLLDLTFVDPSGARRRVKGMIGKTIFEVCEMQGIEIGPASVGTPPEIKRTDTWIEPTFGEGITSGYDHVVLVGNGKDTAARITPIETQMLEDYWDWDEIFQDSRLASQVTLTKEMDGMTVYVPDRIVDDCP